MTIFTLSLSEVDTGITCDGLVSHQVKERGVGGGRSNTPNFFMLQKGTSSHGGLLNSLIRLYPLYLTDSPY